MFADVTQKALIESRGPYQNRDIRPILARTKKHSFHVQKYSELVPTRVFTS
jgi:hypothetical protein